MNRGKWKKATLRERYTMPTTSLPKWYPIYYENAMNFYAVEQYVARRDENESNLSIWSSSADGRDSCSYATTFGGESSWLCLADRYLSYCHGTLQLVQYGRLYNQRSGTARRIIDQATARPTTAVAVHFNGFQLGFRPCVFNTLRGTAPRRSRCSSYCNSTVTAKRWIATHGAFFVGQEKNSLTVPDLSTAHGKSRSQLCYFNLPRRRRSICNNFRSISRRDVTLKKKIGGGDNVQRMPRSWQSECMLRKLAWKPRLRFGPLVRF